MIENNCKWYTDQISKLSNKLYFPSSSIITNKKNINSITFENHDYNHNYQYNFRKLKIINHQNKIAKIKKQMNIVIDKIKKKKIDEKRKDIAIKSYKTKSKKRIENVNKILKSRKICIDVNDKNKNILLGWMHHCNELYNYCVDKFNNKNSKFDLDFTKTKVKIFNDYYKNKDKPVPYDILTDVVKELCSNAKSCFTNLKNGNIDHFKIEKRYRCNCITIPKKSINKNGIFTTKLDHIKNFNKKINTSLIKSDCKLTYNRDDKKFYLYVPQYFEKPISTNNNIVALDPGEKIFMSYYSNKNVGFIGNDIRVPILKIEAKIRKCQRILNKNKNAKGKKLRNRKKIRLKIRKNYRKIHNIVSELHHQTALFLCKNYKRILIPKFETQQMVSNGIKKQKPNDKVKLRNIYRKSRLNGRVKFVLQRLRHYDFRQHLLHKSEEYGCHTEIISEEYTSQCCGSCGKLSKNYSNRIKTCSYCKKQIHRDINGARNILLKNYKCFMKCKV